MPSMTLVLSQGKVAIIDAADYDRVSQFKWYAMRSHNTWYAARSGQNGRPFYLHRAIMGAPDGVEVDHIDGDGLNCRRSNMRLATHKQNMHNNRSWSVSGYKGVSLHKFSGLWRARIRTPEIGEICSYFKTPEEAARAYDALARELHGTFARLNFPNDC